MPKERMYHNKLNVKPSINQANFKRQNYKSCNMIIKIEYVIKKINPISEYHIQILVLHFRKNFNVTETGTRNQTRDGIRNPT